MSRFDSWLNELQPAMFVEMSPELAKERGIQHGDWVVVMDSETSATLASSTPIDPPLNELLVRRFGIRVQPSRAVIPNFGGFASFLKGRARRSFYRFWVNELLDDDLVERFPLETAYPDRIPPTLAFTEALVNRHREQPESRAYLFALNLLAVYALGWMPEKPLYPLGPWEATAKRARKAQEILVFDLFKGRIDAIAKSVYWLSLPRNSIRPRKAFASAACWPTAWECGPS